MVSGSKGNQVKRDSTALAVSPFLYHRKFVHENARPGIGKSATSKLFYLTKGVILVEGLNPYRTIRCKSHISPDISRVKFALYASCRACSCNHLPQAACSKADIVNSARLEGITLVIEFYSVEAGPISCRPEILHEMSSVRR